ncbi:MAG: hypothetical protein JWO62_295 [Acidimicrobiaceae bacterium]|nr:hypothetical protein [Acidimicrobiaceae bacterium]
MSAAPAAAAGSSATCKSVAEIHRGTRISVRREVTRVDGVRKVILVRHRVRYAKVVHRSVCMTTNLDPTFTQASNDPLHVTFHAFVAASGFPGAVLPQGVLSLFVNGSLACATNVRASVNSMDCTVELASTGNQTLITEYLSGTNSASQTEVVNVPNFSTTTTINAESSAGALSFNASTVDQNGNVLSDSTIGSNGLISGSIAITVSSPGMTVNPSSFPIPLEVGCTLTPTQLVSLPGAWYLRGSITTSNAAGCEDTQYNGYVPGNPVTITAAFAKNGYSDSTASYTWSPS